MELCKTTGKACYTTKRDAQTVCNGARVKHWENQAKRIPKRVYECPFCHYWHLTKEIPENERREKTKKRASRLASERRRIKGMEEIIYRYSREY